MIFACINHGAPSQCPRPWRWGSPLRLGTPLDCWTYRVLPRLVLPVMVMLVLGVLQASTHSLKPRTLLLALATMSFLARRAGGGVSKSGVDVSRHGALQHLGGGRRGGGIWVLSLAEFLVDWLRLESSAGWSSTRRVGFRVEFWRASLPTLTPGACFSILCWP